MAAFGDLSAGKKRSLNGKLEQRRIVVLTELLDGLLWQPVVVDIIVSRCAHLDSGLTRGRADNVFLLLW